MKEAVAPRWLCGLCDRLFSGRRPPAPCPCCGAVDSVMPAREVDAAAVRPHGSHAHVWPDEARALVVATPLAVAHRCPACGDVDIHSDARCCGARYRRVREPACRLALRLGPDGRLHYFAEEVRA